MLHRALTAAEQHIAEELQLREVLEPHWFRIEADRYGTYDSDSDISSYGSRIVCKRLLIIKHTPKGVWLDTYKGKKFVFREYVYRGRAFAAPTVVQAKEDFRKRKLYQITRLQFELDRAKEDLQRVDRTTIKLV